MTLESLSLATVVPVISSFLSKNNPFSILDINLISNYTENLNQVQLVQFSFSILLIIYLFKTIYMVLLTYFQNKFVYTLYADFSERLLEYYLEESYSYHINNNSTTMVKNFLIEISNLISFVKSYLNFVTEVFLIFAIVFTLTYLEPIPAILIGGTMTSFFVLYSLLTKSRINYYSTQREVLDSKISKIVTESVNGIKDIKINHLQKFFLNSFKNNQNLNARYATNYNTILTVPKFFFEFAAITSVFLFVWISLYNGAFVNNIITSIGIFIAAAFKMIPSLNKLLNSFQSISYYKNSLDIFYKTIIKLNHNKPMQTQRRLPFEKDIQFKALSFSYNQAENKILDNLNIVLKKKNIIGIMGESGSGKSTFIDLLSGLLSPTNGFFMVDNRVINNSNIHNWKNSIGYVSQNVYLMDDTLKNNIAFGINDNFIDHKKVSNSIKYSGLENFVKNKGEGTNFFVGEFGSKLSGGQRQRVGIARALYRDPELLILDESTASLDKQTEKKIFETLVKLKKKMTIIIISHDMNNFSICDEVYIIENKKIKKIKV